MIRALQPQGESRGESWAPQCVDWDICGGQTMANVAAVSGAARPMTGEEKKVIFASSL